MKSVSIFMAMLFCILPFCGCQQTIPPENISNNTSATVSNKVAIGDSIIFTVEQINAQLVESINTILYYSGTSRENGNIFKNPQLILGQNLEYDLYCEQSTTTGVEQDVFPPKIYFVITNFKHPLSNDEQSLQYELGIAITPFGLRSSFSYQGYSVWGENPSFVKDETVFLGSYSMCITEITRPKHEEMSVEWKEKTITELCFYMEEDTEENPLPKGRYTVHVQGFVESDLDTAVYFEHEDGKIYWGKYLFVHDNDGEKPADLHKVELDEDYMDESFQMHMERIRDNAVLSFEYAKG